MDEQPITGATGDVAEDQFDQIEELLDPMTKDEKEFWSDCYRIAMKNIMYNKPKSFYLAVATMHGDSVAEDCKVFADRALAKYREKKLDVKR